MSKAINHVLITGVAGFIGSNLLDYLLEKTSWNICGIDDLSTGHLRNIQGHLKNPRFEFCQFSCWDVKSLKPYDCIFHLAALPRIQPSFELVNDHIRANLLSSTHILERMIVENHFPRFVFSSSSAIYGTPEIIPTPESEKFNCLSPYAFQKYEVERYLELLSTRFPFDYVNLRYFNPYGPRSFNPENKFNAYSSVVGIFLHQKKTGKKLLITGDGSQKRDFIHVYDVAGANLAAAIFPGTLNTSFNIGHGSTISILELAKLISSEFEFIPKREGEAEITFANIDKAQKILGWRPIHPLKDYLKTAG